MGVTVVLSDGPTSAIPRLSKAVGVVVGAIGRGGSPWLVSAVKALRPGGRRCCVDHLEGPSLGADGAVKGGVSRHGVIRSAAEDP